jgi:hypothetical protein
MRIKLMLPFIFTLYTQRKIVEEDGGSGDGDEVHLP